MKVKIYIISLLLLASGINPIFGQDPFEPNDTYMEAATVTCGQQLSAYIQIVGDVDWYEIQFTESGVLEVEITSVPVILDLNVEIYQVINNVLTLIANDRTSNASGGMNMYSNAVVNPGTYLILVEDENNNSFSDTDSYDMALTCTANALELNQIYDEAAPIATDTCFEANIYGDNHTYAVFNDVDWFEVQVANSGVLEVEVTSVPLNLDLNVGIYQIINNTLTLIADDRTSNSAPGQNVFSYAVINPGTYLISVNEESNNDFNEETYTFCVNFTPNELELNQVWDEAAPIATDTCFEANIYGDNHTYTVFNDVDWFEVQVVNSGVLEVAVTSVPNNLDLNVGIYQYINNVLTLIADDRNSNSSGGQDIFSNAVINPGTYLISVNEESNNDFNEETYTFCVNFTANELELNQIWDEAAPIATDTCFEANIYGDNHTYTVYNDEDWFEVQVSEYGVLEVAVTSVPINLDLNVGIYKIINNTLTLIADDRNSNSSGGQNIFSNAVISPGTYLISVNEESNNDFNEDTYSFCVTFTPNELELNQVWDEAAPIATDTCFEANIYGDNRTYTVFNDVDWFEVQVTEFGVIEVAVTSVPVNLDLDVGIYQYINNVLTLIANDRNNNANGGQDIFSNAVVGPGTYLISVEDEYNDAFNEETYTFCVNFTPNELELNQEWDEAAPIATDTCFEANIYGDNHTYTVFNDVDWFEVQVSEFGVLEVAVTSVPYNLDLDVGIYQYINNVLTLIANDRINNANIGQDVFSNAVVSPGTYLIVVEDEYNDAYNEETYLFCVGFTANELELNQIYDEAAPISNDTCFEANIYGDNHLYAEFNDVDWF
ncbi:MAG: PPC domain-containing protein, partial [Bacteroidales bacterium]|nr:PPC domain-containing protein [Bacteroidales bacterium]